MRAFFSYWWNCIRCASGGNAGFANDWQWLIGVPLFAFFADLVTAKRGGTPMTTGHPILDSVIVAFLVFIPTWIVAFCIRLIKVPVDLDRKRQEEITRLSAELEAEKIKGLDHAKRNSIATRLSEFVAIGNDLRIRISQVTTQEDFDARHAELEAWLAECQEYIQANISEIVLNLFNNPANTGGLRAAYWKNDIQRAGISASYFIEQRLDVLRDQATKHSN